MASVSSASLSNSRIRRRQAADLLPLSPYGDGAADGYEVGLLANGAADQYAGVPPSGAAANGTPSPYGARAAASGPADPDEDMDGYSQGGPAEAGGYDAAREYDGSASRAGAGAGAETAAETPRFPAYSATARPSMPSSSSYELRPSSYTAESKKRSNSRTAATAFPTTAGFEATAYQAHPESTAVPAGGATPYGIAGFPGYLASKYTGYDGHPMYTTTGYPTTYDYTGYPTYNYTGYPPYNYTGYPTYNYTGYPTYNYTGYPMYNYTGSPVAYDNFTGYLMYNYPGYPSPGNPASTKTVTDIVTVETTVTAVPATSGTASAANNRTMTFTTVTTSTSVSVLVCFPSLCD